jgi:hypothetical protein
VSIKPTNVGKFKRRIQAVIAAHEDRLRTGGYATPRECIRQTFRHINLKVMGVEVESGRRSWIACFRIVNDVGQIRQLDRWVWSRLSLLTRRLRLPHRTRSEVFALGYRGLLREYWHTRRHMRSFNLPFQGMVQTQRVAGGGGVREGLGSYAQLNRSTDAIAEEAGM